MAYVHMRGFLWKKGSKSAIKTPIEFSQFNLINQIFFSTLHQLKMIFHHEY